MATNSNNDNTIPSTASIKPTTPTTGTQLFNTHKLDYEIHDCSGFSENFFPENILTDCPNDHNSRWAVQTNKPPQYLVLKLKKPSVVRAVKFGKYEKRSVCNMKKFRIYGGLVEHHLDLLLEAGLNDDSLPEVFRLRCATSNFRPLPILFLKIEPLLSQGGTFNCSIWYVELHGEEDEIDHHWLAMKSHRYFAEYTARQQTEIVRLCLKHFRQQGYQAAFDALQQQTQVRLEDPLFAELHRALISNGDFGSSERLIASCVERGLVDAYLERQQYKHTWNRQQVPQPQDEEDKRMLDDECNEININPGPSNRGGHQLVIDTEKGLIYLYGGWDGYQDLSDMWVYHIATGRWSLLCQNSEQCNGPTPRSCHKMVYDPLSESIFMIGRFLDNSIRTTEYIKSDFFLYDTGARTWLQICDDTSHVGGPQLVYDHQMCIDTDNRRIYIFGGKILTPRSVYSVMTSSEPEYSGLFSYHIPSNAWTQILVDCNEPAKLDDPVTRGIKSRVTHCMVFHPKHRKLYIYGGQRGKEEIDEFITFDVDDEEVRPVFDQSQKIGSVNSGNSSGCGKNEKRMRGNCLVSEMKPTPGYTLRATIDCERDEIYVFSSLNKVKDRRDASSMDDASNSVWVYSLGTHVWRRIYNLKAPTHANSSLLLPQQKEHVWNILEPCPRYAHQFIYDDVAKLHYLFGGNPGRANMATVRLDDLWILRLEKPKREDILMQCRLWIRTLYYEEMTRQDPLKAMQYLQTHIASVIDHDNPEQLTNFHKLASLLFLTEDSGIFATETRDSDPAIEISQDSPLSNDEPMNLVNNQQNVSSLPNPSNYNDINAEISADDLSMDTISSSVVTSSILSTMATTTADNDGSVNKRTTTMADTISYQQYCKSGGKQSFNDYIAELKFRRECLFDKLVRLMPAEYVQPEKNLIDFVTAV